MLASHPLVESSMNVTGHEIHRPGGSYGPIYGRIGGVVVAPQVANRMANFKSTAHSPEARLHPGRERDKGRFETELQRNPIYDFQRPGCSPVTLIDLDMQVSVRRSGWVIDRLHQILPRQGEFIRLVDERPLLRDRRAFHSGRAALTFQKSQLKPIRVEHSSVIIDQAVDSQRTRKAELPAQPSCLSRRASPSISPRSSYDVTGPAEVALTFIMRIYPRITLVEMPIHHVF